MPVNQATTADLQKRSLRPLTDLELQWGSVRLRDAFVQILTQIPTAATRLDAGVVTDPFNQLVIATQAAMVLRVLANPDGVLEESQDDYTRRLDASVSTGALYLTATEAAALTRFDGTSTGAFGVRALPMVVVFPGMFPITSTAVW